MLKNLELYVLLIIVASCSFSESAGSAVSSKMASEILSSKNGFSENNSEVLKSALTKMQAADKIEDDEKRCLEYPGIPGMNWPRNVIANQCALLRKPRYNLSDFERLLKTNEGRKEVNAFYNKLLNDVEKGSASSDQLHRSFSAFGSDEASLKVAEFWYKKEPANAFSQYAYARTLQAAAYKARGQRWVSETASGNLNKARHLAAKSIPIFRAAYSTEPRMTPACTHLASALLITAGGAEAFAVARACMSGAKGAYFNALTWKTSAELRWGGSQEALEEVRMHLVTYAGSFPLFKTIIASIDAYPFIDPSISMTNEGFEGISKAMQSGANSVELNDLSSASRVRKDSVLSMALLSQAVRFEIGAPDYRAYRAYFNLYKDPDWAIIDINKILKIYPDSIYYEGMLMQALENKKMDTAKILLTTDTISIPAERNFMYKATLLYECERDGMIEIAPTAPVENCVDSLVESYPDDSEVWRIRADILHFQNRPGALVAAKKYLEIAQKGSRLYEKNVERYQSWVMADANQH